MDAIKQAVVTAGKLLLNHEISSQAIVKTAWGSINWQLADVGNADAELTDDGSIRLYPGIATCANPTRVILHLFGNLLLKRGGERAETLWDSKLSVPSEDHVRMFKEKLEDDELRKKCKTYEDVIQTYPTQGSAVPRLVGIHMANALLANNIPYADSQGVDVMTWGPTTEFACRKKYHSLIPLVSAYAPPDVFNDFGYALAELVTTDLKTVRESSVAYGLKEIIRNVIQRGR